MKISTYLKRKQNYKFQGQNYNRKNYRDKNKIQIITGTISEIDHLYIHGSSHLCSLSID